MFARGSKVALGLALLAIVPASSGCGIALQSIVGWSDVTTTRTQETQRIAVVSYPAGATITREHRGELRELGVAPLEDTTQIDVEVERDEARLWPLIVGALLLDFVGGAAFAGLSAAAGLGDAFPIMGGMLTVLGTPIDLLTALIYGIASEDTLTRTIEPESQVYAYRAKLGGFPDRQATVTFPTSGQLSLIFDPKARDPNRPTDVVITPPPALSKRADPSWVVAIMELEDPSAQDPQRAIPVALRHNTSDQLRVFAARFVRTIDRGAQERFLKEQIATMKQESFKQCYDDSCQVELGKALAASHILRTRIARFGNRCVLNSELIDLKSEVTVLAATDQGDCTDEGFFQMSENVTNGLFTPK
jgi:hypothetical protein